MFRRLAGCLDEMQSPPLSIKVLSETAHQVSAWTATSEDEKAFVCSLGLRIAESQDWESGIRVLEQAGEAGKTLRGGVAARQWLTTGQKEAYQPHWWRVSSDPWSEMASVWDSLLDMLPAGLSEANPLRVDQYSLAAAVDALAIWQLEILLSDSLRPLKDTGLFEGLNERWKFLSPRSWRLLTSAANVLPPIAGVTPKPERPLLALLHLARHGVDVQALQAVLSSLLAWEMPPLLVLSLLEMALPLTDSNANLSMDLRRLVGAEQIDSLRRSLTPAQSMRLDALAESLPMALASPEAKTILRLNQAKSTEKKIRLALQKAEADDLLLAGVWSQMSQFLTGPHFCRWSQLQWELIRKWRLLISQGDASHTNSLEALPEQDRQVFSSLLLNGLRPIMIDGSNVLRDKKAKQHSDGTLECLEKLWVSLSADGFYPIITYVDRNEFAKQEEEHGPEAKHHLNKLIEAGFIEDGASSTEIGRTADEYILHYIEGEEWQESVIIVTNDDYAKPPAKGGWGNVFSWLDKGGFGRIQAKFRYDANNGQFLVRLPDGGDLRF